MTAFDTIRYLRDRKYEERGVREEILFCERMRMPVIISYWLGWAGILMILIGAPVTVFMLGAN